MHTLTLTSPADIPETSIKIGMDAAKDIADALPADVSRVVVLYDKGVEAIADKLSKHFKDALLLPVQSGDSSKSLSEVDRLSAELIKNDIDRKAALVCVGGGMVTDLGGFLGSVYMRGISCILVPTSMLGMVDASIGGKTAVNVGGRKNMVGTLSHPRAVIIDLSILLDAPEAQYVEGLVEVVKIAAILDLPLFQWLKEHMQGVLKRNETLTEECVLRAVQVKVRTVEQDEKDRDVRLLLNFGHTVGHAVEALSEYRLSHGQAVSIGMIAEMKLAGLDEAPVRELLEALSMPCDLPAEMNREALWEAMMTDKKNEAGSVRAAVPVRLGEGSIVALKKEQFLSLP